jgi:hypothetical protein
MLGAVAQFAVGDGGVLLTLFARFGILAVWWTAGRQIGSNPSHQWLGNRLTIGWVFERKAVNKNCPEGVPKEGIGSGKSPFGNPNHFAGETTALRSGTPSVPAILDLRS